MIKYIEHPSDVGFEVDSDSLDELFSIAAEAMYGLITDPKKIESNIEKLIDIQAEDLESLMFDWIDELLFIFESDQLIFTSFDLHITETDFHLTGKCIGGKFDPKKHESGIIIKAVTYHMMEVKRNDIWKAKVILDV